MGDIALKRTPNYSLPTWEKSDFIQMSDFNDLTQKLDTALKSESDARSEADGTASERITAIAQALGSGGQNCRIAYGSYTGDGTYGAANPTSLTFDFKPELVLVGCEKESAEPKSFLLRPTTRALACDGASIKVTWTANGVSWYTLSTANQHTHQSNTKGYVYRYIAFGYTE